MSMYNMLFGVNVFAPAFLAMLGIDQPGGKWSSGRFRDIHLNKDGTEIILYTRNGGGNREHWPEGGVASPGLGCNCTGCIIEFHLPQHPNYIRDYDDEGDCTYAYIVFSVPKEYLGVMKDLSTGKDPQTVADKFKKEIESMSNMSKKELEEDPRYRSLITVMEKIMDKAT